VLTENSVRFENTGVPTIREIMVAKRMGADVVLNFERTDVIAEIKLLTDGKGVDVAIEALGTQNTFENALGALRQPFAAGLGDQDHQDRYDTLSGEQRANARADGGGLKGRSIRDEW
jgi:NADPH:quinone reductase-like Zn-dependent oxidoreductase